LYEEREKRRVTADAHSPAATFNRNYLSHDVLSRECNIIISSRVAARRDPHHSIAPSNTTHAMRNQPPRSSRQQHRSSAHRALVMALDHQRVSGTHGRKHASAMDAQTRFRAGRDDVGHEITNVVG
jgi:hypothetical protein